MVSKKEGDSPGIEKKKQEALKVSIAEGAANRVSYGFGNNYITPFALALKANSTQIGILSSLSTLTYELVQLFSSRLLEKNSRKKVVSKLVIFEAFFWLVIAGLGIAAHYGKIGSLAVYALIIIYMALMVFSGLAFPAWFSWMGDLIPEKGRGRYLSKRNIVGGAVEIATMAIGIVLIRAFENSGLLLWGLSVFFILTVIFKLIAYSLLKKQYEPRFKLKKTSEFSIFSFIKRYDDMGKFAVYQGVFYFSIMIASPFFIVYMAKELQFSTFTYMTIMFSSAIFSLVFLPLVGRFSDKYGNVKLLQISAFFFALSPLLWLFSKNPIWLGTIPQISTAIANSALVIAYTNFCYNSASREHRSLCISYSNVLIGIGAFFGALLGGLVLDHIKTPGMSIFLVVFIISALLRAATAIYFLPRIKERRKFVHIPHLHSSLSRQVKTLHSEIGWINEVGRKNYAEGLKIWKT
ncbi:MAG: MFS transporter [Nanoarchaeota archaeon]|nr:MFS transporter [Nanoarchaeota archaeon]